MKLGKEESFLIADTFLPFTAFVNRGIDSALHWHTYIELLFVISGKAYITIENEKYEVESDDFLIINSHEAHSSEFDAAQSNEILVIQFEPSVINPSLNSIFESKYIIPFIQKEIKYIKYMKLENNSSLVALLKEILEEFNLKISGYELSIKGNIYKIFSWLIRNNFINNYDGLISNKPLLLRFKDLIEYLEANFQEKVSIKTAAKKSSMSYHYFCRSFKAATGKTFLEYLNFIRLCESEKLLLSTEKSVSEIALEVGFPSVSYFNRLFKKTKNLTPLAFKKQNSSKIGHK